MQSGIWGRKVILGGGEFMRVRIKSNRSWSPTPLPTTTHPTPSPLSCGWPFDNNHYQQHGIGIRWRRSTSGGRSRRGHRPDCCLFVYLLILCCFFICLSVCFRTDLDNFSINPYQGFVDLKKQEKRFLICRQSVPFCFVTFCDLLLLIGTDLKGSKTVKKK